MSVTMHGKPEHVQEVGWATEVHVGCGEGVCEWWDRQLCKCCVCTRASTGPIIKNTEHWDPSCFFSLSQHLNANTITNTMHYLKATVLDPTRSFSIA